MIRALIPLILLSLILLAGVSLGQLATSPWPMFRQNNQHTGRSDYEGPSSPALVWSYATNGDIDRSTASIGSDGNLYFASEDKYCYALGSPGNFLWSHYINEWGCSPAIDTAGRVYIGASNFYALNSDGSLAWTYSLNCYSSPAITDAGRVYVGSYFNRLLALNTAGDFVWSYQTNGQVGSSPAVTSSGRVYVGSEDNNLYAIGILGGLAWSYSTGSNVNSSPAIDSGGTVYVGSWDYRLYAFAPDGGLTWSYRTGNILQYVSPSIGNNGTVYIVNANDRFYAVGSDGNFLWTYGTGGGWYSSPVIGSDSNLYIGSRDNNIYALDSGGEFGWSYQAGDQIVSSPSLGGNGKIYIGSDDNVFYCIGQVPTPTITPTSTRTPTPTPTATPPIDLTAQKTEFSTRDRIEVWADVWPLPVPCYPFVRVVMADGSVQYYAAGVGFTASPTPYLGFEAGAITQAEPLLGYPVLAADFSGIPAGTYVLEGGAVDATRTTSADNLVYFGGVDREPLTVR